MTKKTLSALVTAHYLLSTACRAERKLTNKKLQKLLYYAQAWSLAINKTPLFADPIEAWIHGPVVPSVYHRYKKYGSRPIEEKPRKNEPLLASHKEIIDEVWRVYGKYDADYLELLTHSEAPWINTRHELDCQEASSKVIPHSLMKAFYSDL